MKCPSCTKDQKYKNGMVCTCGYRFVFDPKQDYMTDGRFTAIIRAASGQGTRYYTDNQFYAHYCWKVFRENRTMRIVIFIFAVLCAIATLIFKNLVLGIVTVVFLIITVALCRLSPPARRKWESLINKWRSQQRDIPKLLTDRTLSSPPPEWQEPDIYDYGVERVLIVEKDLLVDLLVLNGLAAAERSLVVSEEGYPHYLVQRAQQLLRASSNLPVYLLHDATDRNVPMRQRIEQSRRYPIDGHPVVDLGLHPKDIRRMPSLRPFGGRRAGFQIPVDLLVYPALSLGITQALAQGMAFGDLLQPSSGWGIGVGYDGFGSEFGAETSDFG